MLPRTPLRRDVIANSCAVPLGVLKPPFFPPRPRWLHVDENRAPSVFSWGRSPRFPKILCSEAATVPLALLSLATSRRKVSCCSRILALVGAREAARRRSSSALRRREDAEKKRQ